MPLRRRRSHYQQFAEFERGCVIGLREGGFSFSDIAKRLRHNVSAVHALFGSSGQGMVLLLENWVPDGHVHY
ncbi:hypothetical protein TNCV_4588371 [Trichonephila clavipes]|nr:hypothetical protein TNCV_4588371 [Trichonephila clavipes]